MALEYRVTFLSDTPVDLVAAHAFPERDDRPTGAPPILRATHFEKYGFQVVVRSGEHGTLDAMSDDGDWEWEPDPYVAVGFRLDKFADRQWVITNMMTVVRRLLLAGSEDAAFLFNNDVLLFTRFKGELVKHNRERWWAFHEASDQLIPG